MARGVAINVGVNKKPEWGGFRGPIFSDGSFEFIHIPWKDKYGMIDPPPKKYKDMRYSAYVPERLQENFVFESPNFRIMTYASTTDAPANKFIGDLGPGDYLLFYSTLDFKGDKNEREEWINPNWGAYIIGFFKINEIYPSIHFVLSDDHAIETFADYDWFKIMVETNPDDLAPWIKGFEEESGLLKKAIPLSRPDDPEKWSDLACKLLRTANGKKLDCNQKAKFNWVLKCENDCLDELLTKCTLRKNS